MLRDWRFRRWVRARWYHYYTRHQQILRDQRLQRLQRWVRELDYGMIEKRQRACMKLGQLRDKRAVVALIRQLGDREAGVRQAACTALGALRVPDAVAPLSAPLIREQLCH